MQDQYALRNKYPEFIFESFSVEVRADGVHAEYLYKLGEAFDFELDGLAAPTLPSPDSKWWSATDLGSVAIGYSVTETPLHIVTFYNAIANKGKMMKPYFV